MYDGSRYLGSSDNRIKNGSYLVLLKNYFSNLTDLQFLGIDQPKGVAYEYYDGNFLSCKELFDEIRNKEPTSKGFIDNMLLPLTYTWKFKAKISSYFIAPCSGQFEFDMRCDDQCLLHLTNITQNTTDNNARIAEFTSFWNNPGNPATVMLTKHKKYFLEVYIKENSGGSYLTVSFKGCGLSVNPITSPYLTNDG